MKLPKGWHEASDEQAWRLGDKLNQALGSGHVLYGRRFRVVGYRHRDHRDELLCWHPEAEDLYSLVHLVGSQASYELRALPPVVELQGHFQDYLDYVTAMEGIRHHEIWLLKDAERKGEVRGRQQGLAMGEKRGLEVGTRQGQIKVLTRQLCRRFSLSPTEVVARVHSASAGQLEQWSDNILTAQTLEQVFEGDGCQQDDVSQRISLNLCNRSGA